MMGRLSTLIELVLTLSDIKTEQTTMVVCYVVFILGIIFKTILRKVSSDMKLKSKNIDQKLMTRYKWRSFLIDLEI